MITNSTVILNSTYPQGQAKSVSIGVLNLWPKKRALSNSRINIKLGDIQVIRDEESKCVIH